MTVPRFLLLLLIGELTRRSLEARGIFLSSPAYWLISVGVLFVAQVLMDVMVTQCVR